MKKLLYIANLRLPTEKAYGVQITKMCEAFVSEGLDVTLVYPFRKNDIKDNIFSYYSVRENFKIKKIWAPDFYLPGKLDRISVLFKDFISGAILAVYGLFSNVDIIYSRDEWPLYFLSFFKKNLIYEAHRFSAGRKFFYRRSKSKNLKIMVITTRLKGDFINLGFKHENIFVAPDGVDLAEFDINISKEEARTRVSLPLDGKIVIYTGHLFEWKGAGTLLEAARQCRDILFVFVGGMPRDIENFRKKTKELTLSNVLILGHKLHKDIPFFLKAADILILPNSVKEEISRFYTSPLKLFEYMASKRPIIASDLPSIREVLNETNSLLVNPDKPDALAGGIKKILGDPKMAENISEKAFKDVQEHTWLNRAKIIIND